MWILALWILIKLFFVNIIRGRREKVWIDKFWEVSRCDFFSFKVCVYWERGGCRGPRVRVPSPHPCRFYDIVFSYYFLIINRKETYFLIHRREAAGLYLNCLLLIIFFWLSNCWRPLVKYEYILPLGDILNWQILLDTYVYVYNIYPLFFYAGRTK